MTCRGLHHHHNLDDDIMLNILVYVVDNVIMIVDALESDYLIANNVLHRMTGVSRIIGGSSFMKYYTVSRSIQYS